MNAISFRISYVLLSTLLVSTTINGQEPTDDQSDVASTVDNTKDSTASVQGRVTLEVAQDRAKLMHDVYAATLNVMHHRYFHADRAIIPARAMEDVFSEMQQQSNIQARWIAVSFKPMSVNHEAETDFEKRAAKEIAAGKSHVDTVEDGFYRRASAIPLGSSCISCHDGFFRKAPKKPRFAGLVISVPVETDSPQSE